MPSRHAVIFAGLLAVLAMGCGDDKGTNSAANSEIQGRLDRIVGSDFKPSFKIKVSSGTEPTFTWNGGMVNEIWVFDVGTLLAAPLEGV